ncbi:sensor histidine kinase [Mycetocola spongiae]|uniref:sensor histidine kinase n=1 Tax=Mycetocola spongiae TaxID=2859226 RepID=UPI001CF52674|nr:ATP-binding protein [Mycetocola spongiae]UCR90160.1 GHKL domain-containing protein [Mycetocola spongiae]
MRRWSIARRFFVGQFAVILFLTAVISAVLALDEQTRVREEATARMLTLATAVAKNPFVEEALRLAPTEFAAESALLQPYAEALMDAAPADFVTIMTPDRTRLTHRDPARIGAEFIGNTDRAVRGSAQTETFTGTLGPSVRAVVPVFSAEGGVVGMVSAGTTTRTLTETANSRILATGLIAAILALLGGLATWAVQRYLNRVTLGQGPEQLGQIYAFYDAALRSAREGMLLTAPDGRIVLYNHEAARLLGLPEPDPAAPHEPALPSELGEIMRSGRSVSDQIIFTEERVLLVTQHPALGRVDEPAPWLRAHPGLEAEEIAHPRPATVQLGTVTIVRDHTELRRLSGELEGARALATALRSQSHDYANRLHTIITLVEMGRSAEVVPLATGELRASQRLADSVIDASADPTLAALLLGKAAEASERGIELSIVFDGADEGYFLGPMDTLSVLGNLIDNALEALARMPETAERWIEVEIIAGPAELSIAVLDSGPGLRGAALADLTQRGFSTKAVGGGIGLALVARAVRRLGGTLEAEDSPVTGAGARFIVVVRRPEDIKND